MIPAIVYTRFSPRRNSDESESCETQYALCLKYAKVHGMRVEKVFDDRAVSGSKEDRPILWAAISSLQPGGVLLVYKLDRLARNVYLSEYFRRAVETQHCEIVAVEGDVEGNGPEQVMVRQMLNVFAEYERKCIAMRTSAAMRHHQINGRKMSRFAPYGFMLDPSDDRKLIPCEAEKPAMDMVFSLQSRGMSYHQIVMFMNKEMRESARGKRGWYQRTIKRILERM